MQAGGHAFGHQAMVGRMEFDAVEAAALRIERTQLGRVVVREPRLLEHRRRAPMPPEGRQRRGLAARTVGDNRLLQRLVRAVQIDVLIGRRLVEHRLRVGAGGHQVPLAANLSRRLWTADLRACRGPLTRL